MRINGPINGQCLSGGVLVRRVNGAVECKLGIFQIFLKDDGGLISACAQKAS